MEPDQEDKVIYRKFLRTIRPVLLHSKSSKQCFSPVVENNQNQRGYDTKIMTFSSIPQNQDNRDVMEEDEDAAENVEKNIGYEY